MASLRRVPVVDVHSDNIGEVWPSIILAMSNATFIAVDTELSGLGQRKKLNVKSVEERYKNICDVAKSRSILSLGISCFQQLQGSAPVNTLGKQSSKPSSYIVQTFNLTLLSEQPFTVEPASMQFLVQHGFDFNKQYEKGITYFPGSDKEDDTGFKTPRHLFIELISMKKPVIFHNGLVDLVFLYEHLYTSLPSTVAVFLADLIDLFPAGIIDTKYITDYEHRMTASYLEYVFRKCQKDNANSGDTCTIHYPHYPASYPHVTYRDCGVKPVFNIEENPEAYKEVLCISYSGHGWCSKDKFCPKSHDIDLIIDMDIFLETRKSRKRKRRQQNREKRVHLEQQDESKAAENEQETDNGETFNKDQENLTEKPLLTAGEILAKLKSFPSDDSSTANSGHRAGYDAFMTGFILAVYRTNSSDDDESKWLNKLYLTGKDYSLQITKSSFVKQSQHHLDKLEKIRRNGSCA